MKITKLKWLRKFKRMEYNKINKIAYGNRPNYKIRKGRFRLRSFMYTGTRKMLEEVFENKKNKVVEMFRNLY